MQLNANLSKFEESEHIAVNDVKQIPNRSQSNTLQPKRRNGTNPNLGGTNKLKSLLDPQTWRKTNSDYKQQCRAYRIQRTDQ